MAKNKSVNLKRRQVLAPNWYGPILMMNPLGWQRPLFLYIIGWIILFGNSFIPLLVAIDIGILLGVSLFFLFIFPLAVDGKIQLWYQDYRKFDFSMRLYNFLVEGAFHRTVLSILFSLVYAFTLKQLGAEGKWEMLELWAEGLFAWQIIVPTIVIMGIFYANFFLGKKHTNVHEYHQWATAPYAYVSPSEQKKAETTVASTHSSSTLMTQSTPPPNHSMGNAPPRVENPPVSALPERPTNYVRRKSRE